MKHSNQGSLTPGPNVDRTSEQRALDALIPGYKDIWQRIEQAAIAERHGLSVQEKSICSLTYLIATRSNHQLRAQVLQAIDSGVTPEAITEVLLQVGLYSGFSVLEDAAAIIQKTFDGIGIGARQNNVSNCSHDELKREAEKFRSELHGVRSESAHADPANEHTQELYQVATTIGYGLIWRRPGLLLRERLFVALASFVALNLPDSFFLKFARSAKELGVTLDEIRDVVTLTVPYTGFPVGLSKLMRLRDL